MEVVEKDRRRTAGVTAERGLKEREQIVAGRPSLFFVELGWIGGLGKARGRPLPALRAYVTISRWRICQCSDSEQSRELDR